MGACSSGLARACCAHILLCPGLLLQLRPPLHVAIALLLNGDTRQLVCTDEYSLYEQCPTFCPSRA